MSAQSLTVTREFSASPERVYDAMTNLELMRQWMGVKVDSENSVGGSYRIDLEFDGNLYTHEGEYLELEPGRHIKRTLWAGPIGSNAREESPYLNPVMDIHFEPTASGGTKMVFVDNWNGDPLPESDIQASIDTWNWWFDRMEKIL